jgi:hypothetical protein
MGERRNEYRIVMGKVERRRPLGEGQDVDERIIFKRIFKK